MQQAVKLKDRYKPVCHQSISPGDVVLIKEPHTKQTNYPMGPVKEVFTNVNNEVTGATVIKGKTRETVKRYLSTLIPLSRRDEYSSSTDTPIISTGDYNVKAMGSAESRPKRKASVECTRRLRLSN